MSISLSSDINSVAKQLNTRNDKDAKSTALQNKLSNLNSADDAELMEACKSFEAYLVEQVMTKVKDAMVPEKEDEEGKEYLEMFEEKLYESNFCGLYERKEHKTLELNNCPITEYRSAGSSLGEIHLSLAAKELGIPLICSDDRGTKKLARMMSDESFTLEVYTLGETLQTISQNPCTNISYDDCKHMLVYLKEHNRKRYDKEIKKIHSNYNNSTSFCK